MLKIKYILKKIKIKILKILKNLIIIMKNQKEYLTL